jgi:hypothetical protein
MVFNFVRRSPQTEALKPNLVAVCPHCSTLPEAENAEARPDGLIERLVQALTDSSCYRNAV